MFFCLNLNAKQKVMVSHYFFLVKSLVMYLACFHEQAMEHVILQEIVIDCSNLSSDQKSTVLLKFTHLNTSVL